jgi:RNA polymerase sigma-B factor
VQRSTEDSRTADRLWAEYARTGDPELRAALIGQFERLAFSLANRYARGGPPDEDLYQVARMGLVKAVDRFDPDTHNRFSTFATPTILGEIRRYFRDCSWRVHVPRGMQERAHRVRRVGRNLAEQLGREPAASEIATELGVAEDQVREALALDEVTRPLSLDGAFEADKTGGSPVLEEALGKEDPALDCVECRVSVNQALSFLNARLRRVIELRYLGGLSQREVARRLRVSPMQVCRLERQALNCLRRQFVAV